LFSLWSLRRRTNIDFEDENQIEQEYAYSKGVLSDFGILLRGLLTLSYGSSLDTTLDKIEILGIRIDNLDMEQALDRVEGLLADCQGPAQVAFVNPHCANLACVDQLYSQVLEESTLVLVDGIGMKIAGRILGFDISQNVNGTDLFPRLCARLEHSGRSVFFLGAEPGIPERVVAWTKSQFPGLEVAGFHHGYFNPDEDAAVIQQIQDSGAELVLVAMGVPRQEVWVSEHLHRFGTSVVMGVGGLFDFYSGKTPRAPQWLRELGLEWTYRFYCEPRRLWRRYILGNITFLAKVTVQALTRRYSRNTT
jgi:N-acetylglucosaminyldiphosphoundecaprenol N-acetyl-beta-D-mannosaminyltransferase